MSLAALPYPNVLRVVVQQFLAFVKVPENYTLVGEDQAELSNLLEMIANLDGDFNHHLKYHPQLLVCISWYHAKYAGQLADIVRQGTTHFNIIYTQKRANGYAEWDAKRAAETDKAWLDMAFKEDRLKRLVNILKSLVDACKERRPVLEQIANNYRAEVRGDQSTI